MKLTLPAAAIALPTGVAVIVMLDTTLAFGPKMLEITGIKRFSFTTNCDQNGSLKAYRSTDSGTTWDLYSTTAVTAPSAGAIVGPYDYLVDTYSDWKLTWTNGGVSQTVWSPEMHGHTDRAPGT